LALFGLFNRSAILKEQNDSRKSEAFSAKL
jgi:hypothetical protein